ncbi:MAG: SsrA-binding protein SmpB [Bradymonadia bacterium]
MASLKDGQKKIIARNKRAKHDYAIGDSFEAGIVLQGTEVKSLRDGKATIAEAYVQITDFEAFLHGCHIPEYLYGNRNNHEPRRTRKLLLKRREINKIKIQLEQKGYTAVPLELYFRDGYAKLSFGLGKGKKLHDKRQSEKAKTAKRELRDQY